MSFFQRLRQGLGGAKPADDLAKAYPQDAFQPADRLSAYPKKNRPSDKGVFAHRLEFMVPAADAALVIDALASEFDLPSGTVFQEGEARRGQKAVHFSIRQEFGGAVVVILTNSLSLLTKIDALKLEPPPPWVVFPNIDPSTLGSLQGSMEYWWDWLFLPFWSELEFSDRARYLKNHATDEHWLEFLNTHTP
jgi:hypothetical protein